MRQLAACRRFTSLASGIEAGSSRGGCKNWRLFMTRSGVGSGWVVSTVHLKRSMKCSKNQDEVRCCRVGPGNFTPSLSQIPYVNLSIHTARATARRLPPSAEHSGSSRFDPVGPSSTAMTRPLCSTGITPASTLLRGSPPLSGASVLSASRLEPLVPFPLASPARFSRSAQEPD